MAGWTRLAEHGWLAGLAGLAGCDCPPHCFTTGSRHARSAPCLVPSLAEGRGQCLLCTPRHPQAGTPLCVYKLLSLKILHCCTPLYKEPARLLNRGSASAPTSSPYHPPATKHCHPRLPHLSVSASCPPAGPSSIENSYWKPLQPPPSTITRSTTGCPDCRAKVQAQHSMAEGKGRV